MLIDLFYFPAAGSRIIATTPQKLNGKPIGVRGATATGTGVIGITPFLGAADNAAIAKNLAHQVPKWTLLRDPESPAGICVVNHEYKGASGAQQFSALIHSNSQVFCMMKTPHSDHITKRILWKTGPHNDHGHAITIYAHY